MHRKRDQTESSGGFLRASHSQAHHVKLLNGEKGLEQLIPLINCRGNLERARNLIIAGILKRHRKTRRASFDVIGVAHRIECPESSSSSIGFPIFVVSFYV